MPSLKTLIAVAALGCLASAKTVEITATSDNKFEPDSVQADKGDILEFHFEAKNHSVVAGDYRTPCAPMQLGSGFYSGFISTDDEADRVFRVTLNDTMPLVFYSSQGDECSKGMVGIVNQNDDRTLKDYRDRASSLSRAVTPGREHFGGELVNDDGKGDKDDKDGDEGIAGTVRVPVMALVSVVLLLSVV